jgi:hypothetical protein
MAYDTLRDAPSSATAWQAGPEAQRPLTAMLDRWTGLLDSMDIPNPRAGTGPSSITLTGESGETIVLDQPWHGPSHPAAARHSAMGHVNVLSARQEIDGVPHVLHVSSEGAPYVIAADRGELVEPLTTVEAMMGLCLSGTVELSQPQ